MTDPSDTSRASTTDSEPKPAPVLNIIALDDDADFRQFIKSMLETEGHEVRVAAGPEAFFTACEETLPDIVLLDMKMGPHSGEQVLARIRQRWPRLCVIIVTGYPSLGSMRQTFKQDAFDYLSKPFGVEELRRALTQAAEAYELGQRPQDRLRPQLGRQIRLARADHGWTLKDLSEASGISVSQLSSIERGAHLPSLESLLAIAVAMKHTPSAWLGAAGF